jgi:nitrite reductase/ring-hydroxylating ferredoxin subunit
MDDEDLTITFWEGKFFAYESKCPHRKGPIFLGKLKSNACITCPSHKITFSLGTGEIIHNPIPVSMKDYHDTGNLRIFRILEEENEIVVEY